ncbi:MAG: twin-arginine translocase subunit TatC [Burkholderiales bacterium]|nr:twin-arginine translocase subunit TatC [Burkholderiales bacterium]
MSEQETFISHLIELRDRILRALIAFAVVFVCLFPFAQDLYTLVAGPMLAALPKGKEMLATGVASPFFIPVKVTMMCAFVVALPYILYQVWAFVAPGLYAHEKKLIAPLVVSSTALFLCGMAFAYFLVLPTVFRFLASFTPEGVSFAPDISQYLDFVLTLLIAFGLAFEVPVVVVVLVRMGVVSVEKLKEIRPYVIVGAFVIGAIFTPPDVISQLMLAIPMWLLYELGIIVAGMLGRRAVQEESLDDAPGAGGGT